MFIVSDRFLGTFPLSNTCLVIEINVGLICACLIAMGPFLKTTLSNFWSIADHSRYRKSGQRSTQQSYQMGRGKLSWPKSFRRHTTAFSETRTPRRYPNDSLENLTGTDDLSKARADLQVTQAPENRDAFRLDEIYVTRDIDVVEEGRGIAA